MPLFRTWNEGIGSNGRHGGRPKPAPRNEHPLRQKDQTGDYFYRGIKSFFDEILMPMCYVKSMSDQEENNALRRRIIALEDEVRTIHSQLDDIRKIFSSAYSLLSNSDRSSSRSIGCLARHIEEIEERLDPTFNRTFPHQAEFISETQAIFDSARKRSF